MTCSSFLLGVAMGLVLSREMWEGCCLLSGLPLSLPPLPPTGLLPSRGWSRRQRAGAWGPEWPRAEPQALNEWEINFHWVQPLRFGDLLVSSTEEWIKKMWYIYKMEYYPAIEKEGNNTICSNMDGPIDCHAKWSQRRTNIVCYHLYVESKKMIQMNSFTKQK